MTGLSMVNSKFFYGGLGGSIPIMECLFLFSIPSNRWSIVPSSLPWPRGEQSQLPLAPASRLQWSQLNREQFLFGRFQITVTSLDNHDSGSGMSDWACGTEVRCSLGAPNLSVLFSTEQCMRAKCLVESQYPAVKMWGMASRVTLRTITLRWGNRDPLRPWNPS